MKLELNEPLTKALRIDPEIRREKVGQMHCKGQGQQILKKDHRTASVVRVLLSQTERMEAFQPSQFSFKQGTYLFIS